MEVIQVPLKIEIFERLKALAEPLVDDASSVVDRLIRHWESAPPVSRTLTIASPDPSPATWRSARGERFVVGTKLKARYLGHAYEATVTAEGIEFNGRKYDNPSSAGIAAKKSTGTEGQAASTNGWSFWEMQDTKTKRWVSIDLLRSANRG